MALNKKIKLSFKLKFYKLVVPLLFCFGKKFIHLYFLSF